MFYSKPLRNQNKINCMLTIKAELIMLSATHLAVVRGLPTKKFLPKCVNEKSSTERCS